MCPVIHNPPAAKFALLSAFLAAETYLKLCAVYGQNMSEGAARQGCRMFKDWRKMFTMKVEVGGRSSLVSDNLVKIVDQKIDERRCFTVSEFCANVHNFHHSTKLSQLDRLSQVSRKMGSKILTSVHKTQRMSSALAFLEQYHKDGDEFLSHIVGVTGDETCLSFVNVETKEESMQWMHIHSPNKLKVFKQIMSARKLLATLFRDRKGVMMVELRQRGTTIA
jgi:hypothetical protein